MIIQYKISQIERGSQDTQQKSANREREVSHSIQIKIERRSPHSTKTSQIKSITNQLQVSKKLILSL